MTDEAKTLETLDPVGGHTALDFVNTVNSWHGAEPGAEFLHDYADVLRWHRMAGLLGPHNTRALSGGSAREQARALEGVRAFRASLHALFHAIATAGPLPQAALDDLNEAIRKTAGWRRLVARGSEIICGWDFTGAPPDAVVGPVAWQAVELLEHGETQRIKECPDGEGCGWLFLDSSKNRSRTWCSMKTCGNSAKVKRFRARREQKP
jgi:predicted RNA-binding Zn ribbon-like protein